MLLTDLDILRLYKAGSTRQNSAATGCSSLGGYVEVPELDSSNCPVDRRGKRRGTSRMASKKGERVKEV